MRQTLLTTLLSVSLFCFGGNIKDYKADSLAAPLHIPLVLSGNFAELRTNHFHAGIDIKTQGVEGIPVYAPADGYISRIKISTSGYGHALYIDHPQLGLTTVYGHLSGYIPKIDSLAKAKHYQLEKYNIDFYIEKDAIKVKKGDLIAYTGNTGSSGGPHLHFEIRDSETQDPINPLYFGFDIKDTTRPSINGLRIYPHPGDGVVDYKLEDSKFYPVVFYSGKYHLKGNPQINAWGKIGFGVNTIDYLDGSWNKCGIYTIELYDNKELIFKQEMNRIPYSEMHYINAHIDQETYRKSHVKYQYAFQAKPNNPLSVYKTMRHDGLIDFSDSITHEITYLIKDTYGNTSELVFTVNSKKQDIPPINRNNYLKWKEPHQIITEQFELNIPKNGFYEDQTLNYSMTPDSAFYAPIINLDNHHKLLNKKAELIIRPDSTCSIPIEKMIICELDDNNQPSFIPTKIKNDVLTAKVSSLGTFSITCDTIAPTLERYNIYNGKKFNSIATFGFKVKDDFSGLWDYTATIDGKWALFYYESKKNYIYYTIDPTRLEKGKNHQLHFEAWDATNNKINQNLEFYW